MRKRGEGGLMMLGLLALLGIAQVGLVVARAGRLVWQWAGGENVWGGEQ